MSMIVMGIGCALVIIPSIPEFIRIGTILHPKKAELVNNYSSGLFSGQISLGGIIGPNMAGILVDQLGYPRGSSVFSLFILAIGISYVIFSR